MPVSTQRDASPLVRGFAAAMLLAASAMAATAQGLDAEGAIDTIVGSDVVTAEEDAAADEERIVAAIENTTDAAAEVRRKFSLDRVEIVFLADLDKEDGDTPVETKLEEHASEINELRESIQGSAMFYHAIDSRSVLLNDIVALEFDDDNGVTIFVKGQRPSGQ